METKTCSNCGEMKPSAASFAARGNQCKACLAAYARDRRRKNPERARADSAAARRKRLAADPGGVREYTRQRNAEWRAANPERWKESNKRLHKLWSDNLARSYVLSQLLRGDGSLEDSKVPEELIELKREQLRLHRLAKELKQAATKAKDQP